MFNCIAARAVVPRERTGKHKHLLPKRLKQALGTESISSDTKGGRCVDNTGVHDSGHLPFTTMAKRVSFQCLVRVLFPLFLIMLKRYYIAALTGVFDPGFRATLLTSILSCILIVPLIPAIKS